jgi:hypothetical protein
MQLSAEELQVLQRGEPLSLDIEGARYVVLSEAVFNRIKHAVGDALDPDTLYELIENVMADDDALDASLESYQKYR